MDATEQHMLDTFQRTKTYEDGLREMLDAALTACLKPAAFTGNPSHTRTSAWNECYQAIRRAALERFGVKE